MTFQIVNHIINLTYLLIDSGTLVVCDGSALLLLGSSTLCVTFLQKITHVSVSLL